MSDLIELEDSISKNRKIVELGNRVERLFNNQDFKKIISEGFLKQDILELSMQITPDNKEDIINRIFTKRYLSDYLIRLIAEKDLAEKSIEDDQETLSTLLNGEH